MLLSEQLIRDALIQGSYISKEDLDNAALQASNTRLNLLEYLITHEITTNNLIGQAIAEYYRVPFADLKKYPPARDLVQELPEEIARKRHSVLFKKENQAYIIATDIAQDEVAISEFKQSLPSYSFTFAFALPEDIDATLGLYQATLETRFMKILKESHGVAPGIVDEIFRDAFAYFASDIHFEPRETEVVIRFRVDGVLHDVGKIPKEYYESILNRVKVLAKLRIDEHASAQDGAIRYAHEDYRIDLRISIIPTVEGEKIEIRVLSGYSRNIGLTDLGFSQADEKILLEASRKPFGMILVTGPTGSGKTTTLYAVLETLNRPEVNITTIEDPVEYKIPGINQIQVNLQTNLTFAQGLRSIVRQDPDVILVGEIRDHETAEIAVNASLTGHLLLSTFHANDSATAIPRLMEMGIETFILSSTIELIIAQRLVRRICKHCRVSVMLERNNLDVLVSESIRYFPKTPVTLYKGKGCERCGMTGYTGRIGIFELIKITPEMKELVLKHPNSGQIWELAVTQGSQSLFEDGVDKVINGMTTIEELARVAPPPMSFFHSAQFQ